MSSTPATMRSARFASRPAILRRCGAGGRDEVGLQRVELGAGEREVVQRVRAPPPSRRAAMMWPRSLIVPLLPTAIFGSNARDLDGPGRRARRGCACASRRRSAFDDRVGPHELGGEAADAEAHARRPARGPTTSPTMISTLPPPMSMHTRGRGVERRPLARIAAKISRASSRPLITSTSTPVSASMRSTSSLPLLAVRIALVALAITSCAPAASASWRKPAHRRDRARRRPPA